MDRWSRVTKRTRAPKASMGPPHSSQQRCSADNQNSRSIDISAVLGPPVRRWHRHRDSPGGRIVGQPRIAPPDRYHLGLTQRLTASKQTVAVRATRSEVSVTMSQAGDPTTEVPASDTSPASCPDNDLVWMFHSTDSPLGDCWQASGCLPGGLRSSPAPGGDRCLRSGWTTAGSRAAAGEAGPCPVGRGGRR